jgi:hypothetical protein
MAGKKGLISSRVASSQVDWAISLAIFIIYIAWFFVMVRPRFIHDQELAPLMDLLDETFISSMSWEVRKFPVFYNSSTTGDDEPVILELASLANRSFSFSNRRYYTYLDGKVYFLRDIRNETYSEWIVYSDENYTTDFEYKDLDSTSSSAVVNKDNFIAYFDNSSLSRIKFNDEMRLASVEYYFNSINFSPSSAEFNSSEILACYGISSGEYNITQMVFANHPRIYLFVEPSQNISYEFTLSLELDDYEKYYADNAQYGDINYSNNCYNASSDFIDFYYSTEGMAIKMPVESSMRFCAINSSTLYANITLQANSSFEYIIQCTTM